jgi:hypothetical protein
MNILQSTEKWTERTARAINSTVCFCLAYITVTVAFWFSMSGTAAFFKFNSFVYYYGIRILLNHGRWDKLNVTFIFSTGPIAALLVGLFGAFLFSQLKHIKSVLNVYFAWLFVVGGTIFSVQALIASLGANEYNSPFYQNFAVALAWWRIPKGGVYFLNIPFAAVFVFFATNYPRLFLQFAYSYTKVNKLSRKRKYYMDIVLVPFLIGAVGVTALTFPENMFVHLTYILGILIALLIGFVSVTYIDILKDEALRYKNLQQVSFGMIILLGLAVAGIILTWSGIFV